jgi:hypothetical protein
VAPQCAHLTVPKSLHRPRDKHAERQTRGKNGAQKGQSASFRVVISLFVPLGGGSAVRQSGAMLWSHTGGMVSVQHSCRRTIPNRGGVRTDRRTDQVKILKKPSRS